MVERRRLAVAGWLPTLTRNFVQVVDLDHEDRSIAYFLRILAENSIPHELKESLGVELFDSLSSFARNLHDTGEDVSPSSLPEAMNLSGPLLVSLAKPKRAQRRFFTRKRDLNRYYSDDDSDSEDCVAPVPLNVEDRSVMQAKQLLFSDSDGFSVTYAEFVSVAVGDPSSPSLFTVSKLCQFFPILDFPEYVSGALLLRLSLIVLARFLTEDRAHEMLSLMEKRFQLGDFKGLRSAALAIDVLAYIVASSLKENFDDAAFLDRAVGLMLDVLSQCLESEGASISTLLSRLVFTCLRVFLYTSHHGFPTNKEAVLLNTAPFLRTHLRSFLRELVDLQDLVSHSAEPEKRTCYLIFSLLKEVSASTDVESKRDLTSFLVDIGHKWFSCSCIQSTELVHFLCNLIEPGHVSERLAALASLMLRSRGSEVGDEPFAFAVFEPLVSCFETGCSLADVSFLNEVLNVLSSPDDVSYLVESCILPNLVRISAQGEEKALVDEREVFEDLLKALVSFMDTSSCCLTISDVIMSHVQSFLCLVVGSSVFPMAVSKLVEKATSDRSEDLVQAMHKQFEESLRVAASDIWVLVSSSAMPFFKRLVGFLELFNLLKEVVAPETSSKLNSDAQRLANLCCEYMSSPSKDFRSNSRVSQLLALSLKLYFDQAIFAKIVKVVGESKECAQSSLILTLPNALLEVASEYDRNAQKVPESPLLSSEEQSDLCESDACDLRDPKFYDGPSVVVNLDFLLLAVECVRAAVRSHSSFDDYLDYCVRSFSSRMRLFKFESVGDLDQVVDKLLNLCVECVDRNVPSTTFDALVFSLFFFIEQRSSPDYVYLLFRMVDASPHLQTSVFNALNRVFDACPYQNSASLRFPIALSHCGTEELRLPETRPKPEVPQDRTSKALPRSFTVIETLERLLAGSVNSRASEPDLKALANRGPAPRKDEEALSISAAAAFLSFDSAHRTSFAEGLSVSFWLRVSDGDDLVHVVSLGSTAFHVSLFVIPDEKRVVLTISVNGMVVARKSVKRHFHSLKWSHVVVSFRVAELQASSQLLIGDSIHELNYDLTTAGHGEGEQSSAVGYCSVAFGATSSVAGCRWLYETASFFGFKGVLSPTAALVLRGFGFQVNSLTRCLSDCQQVSRLPLVFTRAILSTKRIHFDALLNDSDKFVQLLQRSLLFVFNCDKPEVYGLSGLQPGVNSHLLEEVRRGGDSALFSLISFREFPIVWKGSPHQVAVESGIDSALRSLGAVKLLLFYYAQSVDLNLERNAQVATLRTLFKSLRRDPSNYSRFKHINGNDIIAAMLSNPNAVVDGEVLWELASHLVSDLEKTEEGISVGWMSAVLEPDFLMLLICSPKIWGNHRLLHWTELVKMTSSCVREGSKFSDFNVQQLKRVNFLQNMLHAVVDMMQSSADYGIWECNDTLIDSFMILIRRLVGSPASVDTVISLWNFMLLSHPATDTYIVSDIQGYNGWLRIDSMRCAESEPVILGETPLSALLSNIYETLGKNRVSEVWKKTASVTAIRKVYRECLNVQNGTSRGRTASTISSLDSSLLEASGRSSENTDTEQEVLADLSGPGAEEMEVMSSGIADLRAAILEHLCSLLITGSDNLVKVLFSHAAFRWESVLVLLTSQTDPRIRDSVFTFLQNFFHRSEFQHPSARLSFIASDGFVLLGNQMRNYPVSSVIADALFGILCGHPVTLANGLDERHIKEIAVDKFICAALHAVFVCFEESVPDNALFWNIGGALQKIFESNSILMQAMMDSGLVETMSSVLYRMSKLPLEEDCDVFGVHYLANRGEMWLSFASHIISQCVPFEELSLYNKCEEFVWLTLMADWQASLNQQNAGFVREQLSGLLLHWINCISSSVQKQGRSASTVPSMEDVHLGMTASETDTLSDDFEMVSTVSGSYDTSRIVSGSDLPSLFSQSFSDLKDRFLGTQNVSKLLEVKYKWKTHMVLAKPTDLSHRVCFALEMASHLFVSLALPRAVSEVEQELFQLVLTMFSSSWKTEAYTPKRPLRRNGDHPVTWSGLLSISRDRVHVLFAQLIAFALYPAQLKCKVLSGDPYEESESSYVANRQCAIVASLCYEVNCKQMLRTLLDINLDGQYAMNVALHEMALCASDTDDRRDRCIDQLVTFLRNVQIESPFANLSFDGINSLIQDEIISLHSYSSHRKTFFDRMRSKATEIVDRESRATDRISMDAMGVTCTVTETQNMPRKAFMRHLRLLENKNYVAEKTLTTMCHELAHLEGTAFHKKAWFGGWSLDGTEGPNRERRRLLPAHFSYPDRFVLEEHREKLRSREQRAPFDFLELNNSTDLSTRLNRAEISEGIRHSVGATVVRSTFECSGEVLLCDSKLYFFGESAKSTQKGTHCSAITFYWHYSEVSRFFKRFFLLEDNALEVFLLSGDAYLIVFASSAVRETFLEHFTRMSMPRLSSFSSDPTDSNLHSLTHRWRTGAMTNFEYIMHLNTLAGRSYNDLMQYPIAPFIIADFKSVVLDLEAPSTYRNLSKPMAIQDKSMEEHYLRNFHCLETEAKRTSADSGDGIINFGPYHYGSHYSNSGIVVHYLVRLSPFTNIALEYQDNNFDIADRLFNSIETTWRLASKESTTDFKEAIPEFFYLLEFLQNLNSLDLGVKQNGDRVDDVILPQWCPHRGRPLGYRLFCLIHRQALESHVVTAGLHNWIDLIFGYKQTGEAAVKAINVFHPATYRDKKFELNGAHNYDELSVSALRTMVRTYGQMPIQLFSAPHLPHLDLKQPTSGERQRVPPNLFNSISGLQWGDFLGSPDGASGRISSVMSVHVHEKIDRLFVFPDSVASCGGLPPKTAMWYKLASSKNYEDQTVTDSRGVISWNFFDNVLRFKLIKTDDSVWLNLVDFGILKVASVAVSYAKSHIFVGFVSGVVHVYHLEVTSSGFAMCHLKSELYAHRKTVTAISICDEFGFATTADQSGKVCFWDLNKLTFIRSYTCPRAISLSHISPTTGDVALVMNGSPGSSESAVTLLTINGVEVNTLALSGEVASLTMTTLAEGRAINCLFLGMRDGTIRVVEMWTLTEVNLVTVEVPADNREIISMQFSSYCKKLYVLLKSGYIQCLQCASGNRGKPPSFHLINPF